MTNGAVSGTMRPEVGYMWTLLGVGSFFYLKFMLLCLPLVILFICWQGYKQGGWREFRLDLISFLTLAFLLWLGWKVLMWIF